MNNRACEIAVEYRTDKNNMEEQAYEQQPLNRISGAVFCGWGHESVMIVEKNLLILHKLCAHDSKTGYYPSTMSKRKVAYYYDCECNSWTHACTQSMKFS